MNVSNSIVEAIDQVILERNYHQDKLDWECLEKQVPIQPLFKNEAEYKNYVKKLKYDQSLKKKKLSDPNNISLTPQKVDQYFFKSPIINQKIHQRQGVQRVQEIEENLDKNKKISFDQLLMEHK